MNSEPETLETAAKLQWLAEHGVVSVSHKTVPNPRHEDKEEILWEVNHKSLDGLSIVSIQEWDLGKCVSIMMMQVLTRLRRSWL